MKKIIIIIASLLLIGFLTQCGQSDQSTGTDSKAKHGKSDKADKADKAGKDTKGDNDKMAGKGKKDEEIDVDKLDIPERMKKAIKSGRIPKERVKMMLERMKGGGNEPAVQVEAVKRQKINAFLVLNGVVEPERKVEIYSRLSAYVKEIVKEEGAEVKKGTVLALLDDTEIRILHRQAEIQLKQAELTLKDEETNIERSKKLQETEMISEQEFQLAQANYNKAKLDHQTKLENYKDLELQLSYAKIKSASEGFVTERMIEVGTRVNSNQQVFTVEDFSPLLVKVYVPTVDIVNLKTGMDSEISTDVLKGRIFEGKIKLINPRIDVQSGTVKVTLEVFDKTRRLKPGMFVETKILIKNKPDAIVIPKKSVSYKENEAFVFVYDRKQMAVSKRTIVTGISEGDNIEVEDGLNAGERIVIVGVEGLKDKAKVRIVR